VASSAIIPVAMHANWLVAGFQLHRRPVPMSDDPKVIGGIASAMYSVSYPLTVFASWTLVCAIGLLVLISVWPQQFDRRNAIKKLCVSVGAALLVLLIFKCDPWRAVAWYGD
jgi:hypothetical protein